MKLVFLPQALADIERLHEFLSIRNEAAARRALLAIDTGIDLLQENPLIGIAMPDRVERQLFIPFGKSAYVLRYRLHPVQNLLVVVRVWHGREDRQ